MNTPPPDDEVLSLPKRFSKIKSDLLAGDELAITASWERLLQQLQGEVEKLTGATSSALPTINFDNIRYIAPFYSRQIVTHSLYPTRHALDFVSS